MKRLTVNDVPVWGKFKIITAPEKKVLHDFDGEGTGDLPFDVAFREVIAIYAADDYTIIETV